ncbi:DUF4465 domain-containing protein [uncultured Alistipes sp.]|jgi:lipoprotein|uniref:DUF4465 domain-containing protein n=1 Tax=uncultured Alistipes sp. TaxID=538949 RepID=UPI0025F584BE|nr:DUF4465 domain-containing protein [uncultured Alistipes sp.]
MNSLCKHTVAPLTAFSWFAVAALLLSSCSDGDGGGKSSTQYDIISFELAEGMRDAKGQPATLRDLEVEGAYAGGSFKKVLCGKDYMEQEDPNGAYFDDLLFTTADAKTGFGSFYTDMAKNPFGAFDIWGGFALSQNYSQKYTIDGSADFTHSHFSAWTKTGAKKSATFALGYVNDFSGYDYNKPRILFEEPRKVAYMYMANATVTAQWEPDLDDYWFKVSVTGYSDGIKGTTVSQVLISGKSVIADWVKVDCSQLGEVDELRFDITSNDMTGPYLNCPSYFCIDEIALVKQQ